MDDKRADPAANLREWLIETGWRQVVPTLEAALSNARAEALEEAAVLCATARASRAGFGSLTNGDVFAERIRALITTPAPATIPVERVREVLRAERPTACQDNPARWYSVERIAAALSVDLDAEPG